MWIADNTDCDDSTSSIHPNAQEICDNKDNDCDASTPMDINCACTPQTTQKCPLPQSNSLCTQTCTDQGQWSSCDTSRASQENTQASCSNSQDDDCDGLIDCNDPDCGFDASQGTGDCDNDRTCDLFETDRDGDGILDATDQEICTPRDCISLIRLGKAVDDDNDGVCDQKDKCRGTLQSCSPVETSGDRIGCPALYLCDQSQGCFNDPSCLCQTCSSCSDNFFCGYDECSSCSGSCYYTPGLISGTCNICASTSSCSSYQDERDCSSDSCSKGPCQWENNACTEIPKSNFYKDNDNDGFG
ncbi:putative metal-binding motif-containing protein, partial [Candidatus Woesearchaeota archaeon]|nr:putative metal-binding motif-containing protein [Candidatus Woesearchaeota archaeon]